MSDQVSNDQTPQQRLAEAFAQAGNVSVDQVVEGQGQQQEVQQGEGDQASQQQVDQGDGWLSQQPPEVQDVVRSLRREAGGYRVKASQAATRIQELERAQMSESERKDAERSDALSRATNAELGLARLRAIVQVGLPLEAEKFLTGDSPEDIAQNAERLKSLFGNGSTTPQGRQPTARDFGGGVEQGSGQGEMSMNDRIRAATGRM
jgi:hypothetical protein